MGISPWQSMGKMETLAQTMNISKVAVDGSFTNSSSNCTIDGFKQVIYPIVYLFIFFPGAVGNSLSIYVFFQTSQRTSVNIYMQNLAISDLMFVSTLPFRASYFLLGSHWIFGDILCRIMTYSLYMNMYCSIYFLAVLSVVRFVAIVHPFKHGQVTNTKYARITCAAIWIFVLLAASPLLNKGIAGYSNPVKCLDLHPPSTHRLLMMNSFVLVVGFILPFCTILFCYVFAIRALLKSRAQRSRRAVCHRKALLTIVITLILSLICFLPYHILRTVHLLYSSCSQASLHKALVVTLCLAAMNNCLDPFLYYFAAENFKAKIRSLCCR
uniref:Cysteinyl leukotriene receptor 2 n=1 Tax=Taeniopygia guttata TaxID=59729 RepID=A0A674GJM5_TAEGU